MEPETPEQAIGKGYKYLATGLRFAGAIVVFLLGGLALDRWLHTLPLFLIAGTVLGAVLGFVSVYRELAADQANQPTWRERHRSHAGETRGTASTAEEDGERDPRRSREDREKEP
ncbi:MAG TPA: AtpZ/AtpI family protein [Gemmatimonadales bacterium]|jgi:F0F1-type ATP synthase assembly protein I|nr:AtpZ/AtpI family protein [Gemmatimonadales bacterium]